MGYLQRKIQGLLKHIFERYGVFVSQHPRTTILIGFLFSAIMIAGLTQVEYVTDGMVLYIPEKDESTINKATLNAAFGDQTAELTLLLTRHDKGNVLSLDTLVEAFDLEQEIFSTTSTDGKRFQDYCVHYISRPGEPQGACKVLSVFGLFGITNKEQLAFMYPVLMRGYFNKIADSLGGDVQRDENGFVTSAQAMTFLYYVDTSTTQAKDFSDDWMMIIAELINDQPRPTHQIKALAMNFPLMSEETARIADNETPLVAAAFMLVLVFLTIVLSGKPCLRSRIALSTVCLLTVMLSLVCAMGAGGWLNVFVSPITVLLIFVLLGVGVDDVIIIVRSVDHELENPAHGNNLERVISSGLGHASVAITLTSITSFVAFSLASRVKIPVVEKFCLSGALGVLMCYVLQLSVFTGFFVLDTRRRTHKLPDCSLWLRCCYPLGGKNGEPAAVDPTQVIRRGSKDLLQTMEAEPYYEDEKRSQKYGKWLASTPGRIVALASWVAMTGFCLAGIPQTTITIHLKDYYIDDSIVPNYYDQLEEMYPGSPGDLKTVFESTVLPPLDQREKLSAYLQDIIDGTLDYCSMRHEAEGNPLPALLHWVATTKADPDRPASAAEIVTQMENDPQVFGSLAAEFVFSPPFEIAGTPIDPLMYASQFAFQWEDEEKGIASGVTLFFAKYGCKFSMETKTGIDRMTGIKGLLAKHFGELEGIWTFNMFFQNSERDEFMLQMIVENLAIAVSTVTVVIGILMGPGPAIFVGLCVSCLDLCMIGVLAWFGFALDAVAFIILAMTVGMSVDYVVHTTHAFLHSDKSHTAEHRMSETMHRMGACIAEGGGSTFLGMLVLAFAQSNAFRSWCVFRQFFVIMISVILFGLLYGLLWAPTLLVAIVQWSNPDPEKALENVPVDLAATAKVTVKGGDVEAQVGDVGESSESVPIKPKVSATFRDENTTTKRDSGDTEEIQEYDSALEPVADEQSPVMLHVMHLPVDAGDCQSV